MKLERLFLSGFMNFREVATLDLRDIPPGLVSITGENGHGKTRLLDAGLGAIYQLFPSRDGVLADYATERDAFVEATFSIEGRGVYRSRVNVDGPKRNSDAVLQVEQIDGSWAALNDGKVSTHKDAVAQVFPPKELVLASAFAAQNRAGSFVTLGKKDRKDLFGALLGLAHYERMAGTAKTCFDLVEATRARLNERRTLLADQTTETIATELQARANALQAEGGRAELDRRTLKTELDRLEVERPTLVEQAQAHLAGLAKHQAITETIGARAAELTQVGVDRQAALMAFGDDLSVLAKRKADGEAEADAADRLAGAAHAAAVKDLDERIAGNRTLIEKADQIRAAATAKTDAEQQLVDLRTKEQTHRVALDLAREQVETRAIRLAAVVMAESTLAAAKRQAATLGTVPCHGEGAFASCTFLTDATAAAARIPDLEAQVGEGTPLRDGIALWTDKVNAGKTAVAAVQISIAQVEQRIRGLDLAKYASELAAAEARIAGYLREKGVANVLLDSRLKELSDQRARLQADYLEAREALVIRRDTRLAELEERRVAVQRAFEQLESQRAALVAVLPETEPASRLLVLLDEALTKAREAWTTNEVTLAAVAERRQVLQRDREAFTVRVHELSSVSDRLRTVEDRLLVWQLLLKALGRDGLPTLEIAAAGPTVSNLVNDLLQACFGSRFTVELVTQEPKADGKGMKETFDLKVFDNEHGGDPRDIADLSGGERVIVDEALRAALALYVNSRNQAPIRTCWRDETTGALDPENATRYVAMLRKLHELGGFAHVIFISHNLDAAGLADTQIVVKDGQPEIVRRAA